jgi:hypothetical protein
MLRLVAAIPLVLAAAACGAAPPAKPDKGVEKAKWAAEAARVEIVRDDWGIAHVHGKTDADAVFGAIYAQAEDDFRGSRPIISPRSAAPPRRRAKARSGRICASGCGSTRPTSRQNIARARHGCGR